MTWLLIIILSTPTKEVSAPLALSPTTQTCAAMGEAMVARITARVPHIDVSFTCTNQTDA